MTIQPVATELNNQGIISLPENYVLIVSLPTGDVVEIDTRDLNQIDVVASNPRGEVIDVIPILPDPDTDPDPSLSAAQRNPFLS